MKSFVMSLMACAMALFTAVPLMAVDEGVMPPTVSFQDGGQNYSLQLTGVALRKKFVIKVYNIGSYIQDPASLQGDKIQAIMASDKAKQLTLAWLRDVSEDKVKEAYREGFDKTLSDAERAQLKSQIDTYIGFFAGGVKKGDEHILRWLPGGHIEVLHNGQPVGNITNETLAKGLWAIWFGEKSILGDRNALISLLK